LACHKTRKSFCRFNSWETRTFIFPENQELKIRLKDILEINVDEKYYLKTSTIISILNTTFNQRKGLLHSDKDIFATLCEYITTNQIL